jgi:hypothetical protein
MCRGGFTRRGLMGIMCLAGMSCTDDPEPFVGTLLRSQHWEYHDRVEEPLCGTLLSLLDRHTREIGSRIGLDLSAPAPPFRYYKFRDEADLQSAGVCMAGSGACATGRAVYSPHYFHAHEQVHNYAYRAWSGWSAQLLDEGIAVALSCEPLRFIGPDQSPAELLGNPDWRSRIDVDAKDSAGYVAAGYLVTYLATNYGWSKLGDFHRSMPSQVDADTFAQRFASIFPVSLDEAWTQALSIGAQPCIKDWMCDAPLLAEGESAKAACDGQMHRSFTVTGHVGVGLSIQAGNGALTLVRNCTDPAPAQLKLAGRGTSSMHWLDLEPGNYLIADLTGHGLPHGAKLEAYLPSAILAPTCESAGTIALSATDETYVHFAKGEVVGWFVAGGGDGHAYQASTNDLDPGVDETSAVEICEVCGDTSTCTPLRDAITITSPFFVRVHAQSASADHFDSDSPGPFLSITPAGTE